jgi:hypothetical protein
MASVGQSDANALVPATKTVTFTDLGYTGDETLRGVLVTREYSIHWPDAWSAQSGNTLNLHYSHSLALDKHSSMAVDWNGSRLASVLLTPENADQSILQVDIPEDGIKPGYNQLRLVLYMGIHDDYCTDLDNPAVWTTIHSSSSFEFSFVPNQPQLDLSLFPAPLIDGSSLVENHVTFVLPEKPSLNELNVVAAISSKLGQLAAWREIVFDVKYGLSSSDLQNIAGDQIYIGTLEQLGGYSFLDFSAITDGLKKPGVGLIWEQYSPGDEAGVAIILTGIDEAGIIAAGRTLSDSSTYKLLSGQLGVVMKSPVLKEGAEMTGQVITLEELGYKDVTARGTHDQTINFIIPLPMAWVVQTEGTLTLHFAHSEMLDPERSSMNVLVNEVPVSSIALTKENSTDGSADIRLPARLFKVGDNKLTILANLNLSEDYQGRLRCWDDYDDEAWIVAYADSSINLPPGPGGIQVNLSDYPYNFLGLSNLSDVAFVVPDLPNEAVALAVANIASRLGHFVEGEALYPLVVGANPPSGINAEAPNQILIGRPVDNATIQSLNDLLPLPFTTGSNEPQSLEGYAEILPKAGSVGYIETTLTADGQPRLIVTGNNDEGIRWAAEALSDPLLIGDLDGDLVILNSQGRMFTASVKIETTREVAPVVGEEIVPLSGLSTIWILWLSGILFIVSVLILIAIIVLGAINRRKAKDRYEANLR